uniref:Putative secreted protein n=1 Tax=Xenopsylla cheopis TaxID=163159 RepID=A0A6M2E028_XENCH
MFIFIRYFLPTSTILFSIDCSYSSILENTARLSSYLMLLILLPPIVKSPMFLSAFLASHSPWRHTLLPISALLVSSWSNRTLIFCFISSATACGLSN